MEQQTFVARESELEQLDSWLASALAGDCSVCFVAGEAGAGKTALVTEFTRRAQERDEALVVSVGDCNAHTGMGDPYLPFREVLTVLLGDTAARREQGRITRENANRIQRFMNAGVEALVENGPDLVGLFVPGGSILARLGGRAAGRVPWASRLRELQQRAAEPGASKSALTEQTHIYEQYTNVLRAIGARRPLVVVLDDLHWADAASVGLLFHLSRRLGAAPILLVGTYRPEDVSVGRPGEQHPLEPTLQELKRYFGDIVLELGRSDDAEDRSLVDALIDAEPNRMAPSFREALFRHTGGNPLFATELLHDLRERGDLERASDGSWIEAAAVDWSALPPRVEGVIEKRVGRLEHELREILRVASVEGESFTAEVVARVRRADERATVTRLSTELERQHRLVGARDLLRRGGQRISLWRFRHNLFQKYVYGTLTPSERAYLHEDVARVLESLYDGDPDEIAVQLARHFEEAGDLAAALRYRVRAGDRARRLYANTEALQHYDAALALLHRVDGAELDPAEAERVELTIERARADVLEFTGRHAEAEPVYRRALDAPGAAGVDRARLLRGLAAALHGQRRAAEALAALAAADAELGDEPADDDAAHEWFQVRNERLWIHYWEGDVTSMAATIEAAGPSFVRRANPMQRGRFHQLEVLMRYRRDGFMSTPETRQALLSAAAALRGMESRLEAAQVRFGLGFDYLWGGDVDEAVETLTEVMQWSRRAGDRVLELRALTYLAVAARLRGDLATTRALADDGLELALTVDMPEYTAAAHANMAWIAWAEERLPDATRLATDALDLWERHAVAYPALWLAAWPLLAASLHDGELDQALASARRMLRPSQQRLPPEIIAALEHAAAQDGDPAAARPHLERAVTLAAASCGYLLSPARVDRRVQG
jgi:tetratricopeptide (TPR) repeat protein